MRHNIYLDFMNLCHRARVGKDAGAGDMITFNFFRQLRALIEILDPNKIFIIFEGNPLRKKELYPAYKTNRIIDNIDEAAIVRRQQFWNQSDQIRNLLQFFPVTLLLHETQEADDTIYNFVKMQIKLTAHESTDLHTVVSTDTDFIQMLQEFDSCFRLYNPIKKQFVVAPKYSYTSWKSLRGDSADGIPGIFGVGDKTAAKWALDTTILHEKLQQKDIAAIYYRNIDLIKFETWDIKETSQLKQQHCTYNEEFIRAKFGDLGFKTMITDAAWKKFNDTFTSIS